MDVGKITGIIKDSPAEKNGIQIGDKIVRLNNLRVGEEIDPPRAARRAGVQGRAGSHHCGATGNGSRRSQAYRDSSGADQSGRMVGPHDAPRYAFSAPRDRCCVQRDSDRVARAARQRGGQSGNQEGRSHQVSRTGSEARHKKRFARREVGYRRIDRRQGEWEDGHVAVPGRFDAGGARSGRPVDVHHQGPRRSRHHAGRGSEGELVRSGLARGACAWTERSSPSSRMGLPTPL